MKSTRPGEERLAAVRGVVTLGEVAIDLHELEPDEPEAPILVAREDPADQLALDAVGLDQDERAFGAWHVYLGYGSWGRETRRAGRAGLYRIPPARPPWGVRRGRVRRRSCASSAIARAGPGRQRVGAARLDLEADQPERITAHDAQAGPARRIRPRPGPQHALGRLEDGRRQGGRQPQGQREPEGRLVERARGERPCRPRRAPPPDRADPARPARPPPSTSQNPGVTGGARRRTRRPTRRRPAPGASTRRGYRCRRLAWPARRSAPAGRASPWSAAARPRRPARRAERGIPAKIASTGPPMLSIARVASRRASLGRPSAAAASAAMTSAIGIVARRVQAPPWPPRRRRARSPVRQRTSARSTRPARVELAGPASVSSSTRASASDPRRRCDPRQDEVGRAGAAAQRPAGARAGAVMPATAGAARGRAGGGPGRRRRAAGRRPRNSRPARSRTAVGVDGLDRRQRLVEGQDPVVERLLAADPRGHVAGVVHPQLEPAGEVALGLGQLGGRDELVAQPGQLDQDRLDRGRQAGRIDAGRDLERAGVGVVDQARRHVVGQPELLAHRQEQAAAHAVAEDRVEHGQGPAVGMVAMEGRHAEAELGLARVALAESVTRGPAGSAGRRRRTRGRRRCRSRTRPRPGRRLVVAEVADDRDDRVGRPVGAPPEVVDRRSAGRAGTSDSSPQISRPSGPSPNIAVWNRIWQYSDGSSRYERISSMMTARSLSMSAAVEPRPDDQLADDVHRALGLAPRDADPVDRRLAVGRGVERAADAFDRLADRARRRDTRAVPLNVRCSMKWATPTWPAASSREPAST